MPANGKDARSRRDPFTNRERSEDVPVCTRGLPPARPSQTKVPANEAKADARTRTGDPFITSEVLYQLSYVGAADPV
jgi:hypothetical protein